MSSRQTIDVRRWRLSDHLLDQLKNDHFTDVEFVLDDGHRLTAHKIVLGTGSIPSQLPLFRLLKSHLTAY